MKSVIYLFVLVFPTFSAIIGKAQFNPFTNERKLFTAGIGISDWGMPLFATYEHPVADNVTVGGRLSFQSKLETHIYKWKHNIVGVNARGSYHFNELLNAPAEWDFYAGASMGYYLWNTKYTGQGLFVYSGQGKSGFNIDAHVGARYFIQDNFGLSVELGGGSVLAGGTVGLTFLF